MTALSTRPGQRAADALRPVRITRHYTMHAEGSVLIEFGNTKVLCTASVEEKVPPHKKGSGEGWVTAEYGMLPRATHTRSDREAAKGKQSGRTQEIQRLIGRSLRAVFDLKSPGRAHDLARLRRDPGRRRHPHRQHHGRLRGCAGRGEHGCWPKARSPPPRSRAMWQPSAWAFWKVQPLLDLEYVEDSACDTDMNVVMTGAGHYVEVQGTAEGVAFTRQEMDALLALAEKGITELVSRTKGCARRA